MKNTDDGANKACVRISNQKTTHIGKDSIGNRSNNGTAHIAANGTAQNSKQKPEFVVSVGTGNSRQLTDDDGIVLYKPIGQHKTEKKAHEVFAQR